MSIEEELKDAKKRADALALMLRGTLHPGASFILCDDLPGVLIQIDNMVGVLLKERYNRMGRPFIQRLLGD